MKRLFVLVTGLLPDFGIRSFVRLRRLSSLLGCGLQRLVPERGGIRLSAWRYERQVQRCL